MNFRISRGTWIPGNEIESILLRWRYTGANFILAIFNKNISVSFFMQAKKQFGICPCIKLYRIKDLF